MKNTSKSLILAACLAASPTAFGDFLGIYAGGGVWNSDLSGDIGDSNQPGADLRDLGLDDERNRFYFVAFEHPIPVLPNVRLQQTDISLSNVSNISQSFVLDGTPYTVGETIASDLDFSHLDLTLYYQLLDNWVNLDLGLTFRKFDGEVRFRSEGGQASAESIDETVPMLYAKAQFDLPFTGFYVAASGNYTGYDGNNITDLQASVGYLSSGLLLGFGVELGVRNFSVELDDVSNLDADIKIDGPYASIYLHF